MHNQNYIETIVSSFDRVHPKFKQVNFLPLYSLQEEYRQEKNITTIMGNWNRDISKPPLPHQSIVMN